MLGENVFQDYVAEKRLNLPDSEVVLCWPLPDNIYCSLNTEDISTCNCKQNLFVGARF